MLLRPQKPCFTLGGENLRFSFHENGSLMSVIAGNDLVNSVIATRLEGSVDEVVLRIFRENGETECVPLTGRRWGGRFFRCDHALRYLTEMPDCRAEVVFLPVADAGWLRIVRLRGSVSRADLTGMQDIGLAEIPAQRTNELYSAQYVAHHVLESEHGPVIASRQNLPQGGRHPCVWQGMLAGRTAEFATDMLDYPGVSAEGPDAWKTPLPGKVRQGEGTWITLRSEPFSVAGEALFAFFSCYSPDHPEAIGAGELPDLTAFREALAQFERDEVDWDEVPYSSPCLTPALCGRDMTDEEIARLYPERELEERDGQGRLLSFFLPDHRHIVTRRKERRCIRPHASILMNLPDEERLSDNVLSSTVYMRGNFSCQTVIGNTSFHKLTSVNRGNTDLTFMGGTRILIRSGERWQPLGIPSLFEMDFCAARWLYQTEEDTLEVQVRVMTDAPHLRISCRSLRGKRVDMVLTAQLVLGEQEHDHAVEMLQNGTEIRLRHAPEAMCRYPELCWRLLADRPFWTGHDGLFFADGKDTNETLLSLRFDRTDGFSLDILGSLYGEPEGSMKPEEDCQRAQCTALIDRYLHGLNAREVAKRLPAADAARLLHTAPWFLHNALIHFAAPHGLEQTGGAAWGTRDVCQGPFELFLATGHFALAREVLRAVFGHQQADGEWPQWFMFDRYADIHAGECHGDVVLWPIKCLGDYISAAGDRALLDETVGWLENSRAECSLREHLMQALNSLTARFIPGTDLLSYAGGDWDDTLQPAQESMKRRTVSTWTQALAFQTVNVLGDALADDPAAEGLEHIKTRLRAGYERLVIQGVPAGFCLMEADGALTPLLHPLDHATGIRFRLLSLTRGILAGLATKEQTEKQLRLIREHLWAPDGVHLLDRPTHYSGGNCKIFRRAEQAAYIGREIGLQYCHAHIRYVQTLAAAGKYGDAWMELTRLLPPLLEDTVPNACLRQSNMYFSSSDAQLPDRAAFEEHYDQVLRGNVAVQGGWRLYSSGPGIFLACLLRDLLARK